MNCCNEKFCFRSSSVVRCLRGCFNNLLHSHSTNRQDEKLEIRGYFVKKYFYFGSSF